MDRRQRGEGLGVAALPLPEPGEAHRRPQLPRLALLAAGRLEGLAEAGLGGGLVLRPGKVQLPLEAVQLGLVTAVIVLPGNRQPFVQRLERVLEAPGLRVRFAQHAEIAGSPHGRPGGPEGTVSLQENRQPFFPPVLKEQPRPLVKHPQRVPELKTLFSPDGHLLLGGRLRLGPEPAGSTEVSREVHGVAEAEGMADRSSQLARLASNP